MKYLTSHLRSQGHWVTCEFAYSRVEGATDNPWSLGSRPGPGFSLTPGTLTAIQPAFGKAEQTWQAYYSDNLILGDARFVVTNARLDAQGLTMTVKRLGQPSARRIVGPVDPARLLQKRP